MNPQRARLRLAWTRAALGNPRVELVAASSDASFRSYWRTLGTKPSWIVMDAPPEQEDVRPWLDIARRLRAAGLNAPQVKAENIAAGFLLISDLGTQLYLPALNEQSVETLYDAAFETLYALATRVGAEGMPYYDAQRLLAETALMPIWFLRRHLAHDPSAEELALLEAAFHALVVNAQQQPQVFVHRDFHSRNLLLPGPGDASPGIIDFQDAVRGPITYDLVSLLRDCYIAWPDEQVYDWVESFRARLARAGVITADAAQFRRWFDLMGVQRHLKVLGIFCRLWYRDGKAGYLGDLPRVWAYTREVGRRYAEIAPLIDWLEHRIGKRDLSVPINAAAAV